MTPAQTSTTPERFTSGASRCSIKAGHRRDAIVIPSSAVTLETATGGAGKVLVVDESSVAHETQVTVGIRTLDRVEITSGLKGGETVVVEGNYASPDGAKVEVSDAEEEKSPQKKDD